MSEEVKNPRHRPTLYKPEYCEEIIDFFNRPFFTEEDVQTTDKLGRPIIKKVKIPCQLPTIERFSLNLGIHKDTVYEWARNNPDFSVALATAKQAQQEILIQHTLNGFYKENFAKFVAINFTDMKEKTEVTHETKPIQINISKDEEDL